MLTVQNLSAMRNDETLFAKVDFSLAPGEILHITGTNGSGKTTLLHILLGLLPPATGQITWQGVCISQCCSQYQAQLAYVAHKSGVKSHLTVLENLHLVAKLGHSKAGSAMPTILQYFGLQQLSQTIGKYLSAGQRQRVALARLLLLDAKLWVLDEPFTAIDSASIAALQTLLQQHSQQGGMVILTSHQPFMLPGIRQLSLDQRGLV